MKPKRYGYVRNLRSLSPLHYLRQANELPNNTLSWPTLKARAAMHNLLYPPRRAWCQFTPKPRHPDATRSRRKTGAPGQSARDTHADRQARNAPSEALPALQRQTAMMRPPPQTDHPARCRHYQYKPLHTAEELRVDMLWYQSTSQECTL